LDKHPPPKQALAQVADPPSTLHEAINQLTKKVGAKRISVGFYDYDRGMYWQHDGTSLYQAASTIKVPILIALFAEIQKGRFTLDSPVPVRNNFESLADGSSYSIPQEEGSNAFVHDAIGENLPLRALATAMITTSSNLATNVIIDAVGVDQIKADINRLNIPGIDFERRIGDDKASNKGINNRISGEGLIRLFRLIADGQAVSATASGQMMELFLKWRLPSNIKTGLPTAIQTKAHIGSKVGYTSSVSHEIAIIGIPGRKPYVLAVLTEWPSGQGTDQTISKVSRLIYDVFIQETCYKKTTVPKD